ncbi:hypothetical protein BKA81DRAFT_179756 [Phyllosticta paracitricarpa]
MEKRDSRQSRCTTCHYPPPTSVDLPTDTTTDAAEVSAEWLLKPPRYPFGCRGAARLIHSAQVLLRLHAPDRRTPCLCRLELGGERRTVRCICH